MVTSTIRKPSAKANLDMAKAIASLQEQVKANSEAIKQALPKDKVQVSDRDFFSIMFSIMIFISIFTLTFTFFYFNKLDNKIDNRIDKLDSRIDKLDHKIDSNHKQILDILLKRK